MKRALLLSGGGARGAFQVGMLEELVVNQKLDFQIIRGVSVGALNAAFLAQAPSSPNSQEALTEQVKRLKHLWLTEITGNSSVYKKRWGFVGFAFGADSLYSVGPLKEIIHKHVSVDSLMHSGRDFRVGITSLASGKYEESPVKNHPHDFLERILASASIPALFPMVDIQGKDVVVDGGVRNITPLATVFKVDPPPDEIYILLASRIDPHCHGVPDASTEEYAYEAWHDSRLGFKINGLDILKRSVAILTDEVYLDDIRTALHWNERILSMQRLGTEGTQGQPEKGNALLAIHKMLQAFGKRYIPMHIIAPRIWYNENAEVGNRNSPTDFYPELIQKAIAHGMEVAKNKDLWVQGAP